MMWFAGLDPPDWVPPAGSCVVIPDPDADATSFKAKCAKATHGKTVLDYPICDACWDIVKETV